MRSVWTNLRVCWDIQHTSIFIWLAHAFGWGLPAVFLAISLPVTGVSYRLGGTCIPNPRAAFVTVRLPTAHLRSALNGKQWFGWLIAFGCLAALIQFATTGFCLLVYARSLLSDSPAVSNNTSG